MARYLAHRGFIVHVLDSDPQVIDALRPLMSDGVAELYDVADHFPGSHAGSFNSAIIDPPWYDAAIRSFIARTLLSLKEGGTFVCTLPPRLTRPGIARFRAQLISDLVAGGHELLSLENGTVEYMVPRFEAAALQNLALTIFPWRFGDAIHIRKKTAEIPFPIDITKSPVHAYMRSANEFRVFTTSTGTATGTAAVEELKNYSTNISTRAHPDEKPDVWSTEKIGLRVRDLGYVQLALKEWADRKDIATTTTRLVENGVTEADARRLVQLLDEHLRLWSQFASTPPLRSDDQIVEIKKGTLTEWATNPSTREHGDEKDNYRGWYQRDRDRILWSTGFRRLSNKTQLFPIEHDDTVRQRLAHSIEVSQLASTIGASFGLDRDLVEAGALAHDIGHTPFGHAGEHALNNLLNRINPALGGFNHYEHGVDVIRWLEAPYYVSSATKFCGLNLVPEVMECVLKHTYCHGGAEFSTEQLLSQTKHPPTIIKRGYCHLEGQAVRIADKISYLVSDLEDGIRLGVISSADLAACQFFHRPPLDLFGLSSVDLHDQYLAQRRIILKIIMEDVLQATNKRLARLPVNTDVRKHSSYIVDYSEEMHLSVDEIWERLQRSKLHTDRRVVAANLQAAKIVSELTLTLALLPNLIDTPFRSEHARLSERDYMKYYRDRVTDTLRIERALVPFLHLDDMIGKRMSGNGWDVPTQDLVMAKDFVAGLSDSRARVLHGQFLGGGFIGRA